MALGLLRGCPRCPGSMGLSTGGPRLPASRRHPTALSQRWVTDKAAQAGAPAWCSAQAAGSDLAWPPSALPRLVLIASWLLGREQVGRAHGDAGSSQPCSLLTSSPRSDHPVRPQMLSHPRQLPPCPYGAQHSPARSPGQLQVHELLHPSSYQQPLLWGQACHVTLGMTWGIPLGHPTLGLAISGLFATSGP